MQKYLCFALVFLLFGAASEKGQNNGIRFITKEHLASQVRFLADDLLEGRGTGTRGYDLAALYASSQFDQLALVPAGNDGTFFQQVPFRKADLQPEQASLVLLRKNGEENLKYRDDFVMSDDYLRTESAVTADVVFAGFGITAPELKYDDYANADAKGKIVVILQGSPASFPASERAHYSSSQMKEANMVAHGAVGYVTVRTPQEEERSPWERVVRQSGLPGFRWVDPKGNPSRVFPELQGHATLSKAGAQKLFEGSKPGLPEVFEMWKQKKLKSFAVPLQIRIQSKSKHENVKSPNVIAMLPGSDPVLKNEYVVYTAHLDHLGISEPVQGDRINNGAYDNATGTAAVLEIARAFTKLSQKPRRSILFLMVTGEEKGLQGSDYFANYPTVPIDSIVANINMDMLMMLYPLADVVVLGAEHSSLGPLSEAALRKVGLKMGPDPAPEEVRFVRSDQYSFIKKGVPSVMFIAGFESTDRSVKGAEATRKWLRTIYHSPQDGPDQKMEWQSGLKMIQACFLLGLQVANTEQRPAWNAGDFFGTKFGRKSSNAGAPGR